MAGLNALIQRLERMGGDQVKQAIASKVAVAAHDACLLGFQQQRDPYGVPWAPRKPSKADNGHKLLDDTGRMINSLTSRPTANGVTLRILDYAKFHQSGTRFMVARKVFPDPGQGLGMWREPIERASLDAVRELMKAPA